MAFGDKNKKNPFKDSNGPLFGHARREGKETSAKKGDDGQKDNAPPKKSNPSDSTEKDTKPFEPGKSGNNGGGSGMEIKDKVKVNLSPKYDINEDLEEIFEGDMSDIDEHTELVEQYQRELEDIGEDLSFTTRLKRRALMRRFKQRLKISRERSISRRATIDRITSRARKSAINTLKAKFSGGKKIGELSNSEKNRVERMVHQRKNSVIRLTRKLIRKKRELERDRLK